MPLDTFGSEDMGSEINSASTMTPPLPAETNSAATQQPTPQENSISNAVNRYAEALNTSLDTITPAHQDLEVAQYQHVEAQKALNSAEIAVEASENPLSKMAAKIKEAQAQRRENITQGTLDSTNITYENAIRSGAQNLGGEALAQASTPTIEHAMNTTRLETLVRANSQNSIEGASAQMTSSLRQQDELAKQLKQEAAQELEQRQIETFIKTQMYSMERQRENLKQYGKESIITNSPAIIEFCAKSVLANYPKEILPLDKTAWDIQNEKSGNTQDMRKDIEISTMIALEQEFSSRLAFVSQAEKIATEKGEAFDLESFKQIYEKSMMKIGNNREQRFNNLDSKSRYYISSAEGVDGNIYLGGYPAGMLQEYLEVTGHQNASDLTSQELTNAYAFALAYNEKGIEPMDVRNFLIGLAMIESRGASNKNISIQNFRERFYGSTQQLPKTTKNLESIIDSIPNRSIRQSSLLGQMAQWQLTH